MKKSRIWILILILILGIISVVVVTQKEKLPLGDVIQKKDNSISKQAPNEVEMIKGTIGGFNNSILSVKTDKGAKSVNISGTVDIQAVVSGQVGSNDAVTVKTTKDDLLANKEVVVFVEKGTNTARSVYILK